MEAEARHVHGVEQFAMVKIGAFARREEARRLSPIGKMVEVVVAWNEDIRDPIVLPYRRRVLQKTVPAFRVSGRRERPADRLVDDRGERHDREQRDTLPRGRSYGRNPESHYCKEQFGC